MSDYRLEACGACEVVRLRLRTALTMQREMDRLDPIECVDGAWVYRVEFCDDCRRAYEATLEPPKETP